MGRQKHQHCHCFSILSWLVFCKSQILLCSVLCVPARIFLLPKIFTNRELAEIDNETLDDVFDDHDDAYAESHAVPSQFTKLEKND